MPFEFDSRTPIDVISSNLGKELDHLIKLYVGLMLDSGLDHPSIIEVVVRSGNSYARAHRILETYLQEHKKN